MDKEPEMMDRKSRVFLTHHNYVSWYKKIVEESISLYGIYDLLLEGVEPSFEVDPPDYRVKAVNIGDAKTNDRNVRDGHVIDDKGNYLIVDDRTKNLREKVYLQKLAEVASRKEKFENSKRVIKRILIQTLSTEIKDMLQNEGLYLRT